MISSREKFLFMLANQRELPGDAVVVLCGQDGEERLRVGAHVFTQSTNWIKSVGGNAEAVSLVLSGGLSGNGLKSAKDLESTAWMYGISPSRILVESESANTREQALNVTAIAREKGWKRINLVASAYHIPRAYLTFLKELRGIDIVPHAVKHAAWNEKPEGSERTRAELFVGEMGKIALYSEHVASFEEGIESLEQRDS